MDTFNVRRNVEDSFSISVPSGFVESTTPLGKFVDKLTFSAAAPTLSGKPTGATGITMAFSVAQPTVTVLGPSSLTLNDLSNDCYGITRSHTFSTTDVFLAMGLQKITTDGTFYYYNNFKSWSSYIVAIDQGKTINSATIGFYCTKASTGGNGGNISISCEASDDAVAPTDYNSLYAKVRTSAITYDTSGSGSSWSVGNTYVYDVTDSVQEVINRAGWVNGNVMGLVFGSGTDGIEAHCRYFRSYEGGGGPILNISFTP